MSTTNFRIEGGAVSATVMEEGECPMLVVAVGRRELRIEFPSGLALEEFWNQFTDAAQEYMGPLY